MSLRSVDLNLLVTLEAIVEEGSVTRGAERLGISQSAASHALNRLRITFRDELLVRTSAGMVLTDRAVEIASGLSSSLAEIERVVNRYRDFDPKTSSRRFVLHVSDYVAPFLLTGLCSLLRAEAPAVELDVAPFREGESLVQPNELHIKVSNGQDASTTQPVRQERLFEDGYVVLMSRDHPHADRRLTLSAYLELAHIKVAASAVGTNAIDDALATRGLSRRVTITLPSWSDLRGAVAGTDLVVVMPRRWAADPAFSAGCVWRPLPLEEVSFAVDMRWRTRDSYDPGHEWLRSLVRRAFAPPSPQTMGTRAETKLLELDSNQQPAG